MLHKRKRKKNAISLTLDIQQWKNIHIFSLGTVRRTKNINMLPGQSESIQKIRYVRNIFHSLPHSDRMPTFQSPDAPAIAIA